MIQHFEDVRVTWKNFGGREYPYIPKGMRSVTIQLPLDEAEILHDAGWNIRFIGRFGSLNVWLDDEYDQDLSKLDDLKFKTAEIFIEGRPWVVGDRSGVKAYLVSITPKQ